MQIKPVLYKFLPRGSFSIYMSHKLICDKQHLIRRIKDNTSLKMCAKKTRGCGSTHILCVLFQNTRIAADLSGELPQPCCDRQALFEQQAVESVAAECLQVHLVLIIPELLGWTCAGYSRKIKNTTKADRAIRKMQKFIQNRACLTKLNDLRM